MVKRPNDDQMRTEISNKGTFYIYFLCSQLIQTSGGLQKLLAFAAESNIAEVQQHAVRSVIFS